MSPGESLKVNRSLNAGKGGFRDNVLAQLDTEVGVYPFPAEDRG